MMIPKELIQQLYHKFNELAKSESHARWFMKRVEEYLKFNNQRPVSSHSVTQVKEWFSKLGRNKRLQPWQYRQNWGQVIY